MAHVALLCKLSESVFDALHFGGTESEKLVNQQLCGGSLKLRCSASLASLTRDTGPQLVKGDPEKKKHTHEKPVTPARPNISDSALKFTHVLYNLSPAGERADI